MRPFSAIRAQPNRTGDLRPAGHSRRHDDGFTLIELMIVIVVLSIMSGAAIFAVSGIRGDSVKSACQSKWKSLKLSAEAVNTQMGAYPVASDVWSGGDNGTPVSTNNALVAGNNHGFSGADNGALVTSYPAENDFALRYLKNPTGTVPNSFAIRVLRESNGSATGPISGTYTYTDTDCAGL